MAEPKKYWNKNRILLIIGAVIFFAFLGFGGESYLGLKKDKKDLKNDIMKLETEKDVLKDSVIYFKDELLLTEDLKEENYYNDYVREYNKRIRAEQYAEDIKNLLFSYPYLDSLAGAIEYR